MLAQALQMAYEKRKREIGRAWAIEPGFPRLNKSDSCYSIKVINAATLSNTASTRLVNYDGRSLEWVLSLPSKIGRVDAELIWSVLKQHNHKSSLVTFNIHSSVICMAKRSLYRAS